MLPAFVTVVIAERRNIMTGNLVRAIVAALVFLLLPVVVSAQSQFTGLVTDESGAALPGVTVEVSSPVLIEKVRTAVTDGTGRYTIVDLRPGTYKLTYVLTGFATAIRDAVQLPTSFVATVNVEMKVGSLEESITVSGQTPVVDVQQAARTVVLGRDLIDELPTTRSIQSVGQIIPGVRLSNPDVGGELILEPPEMRTHGIGGEDQTMIVDGMSVVAADGGTLPYMNDQMEAEVSVRTSAIPAEISAGGVNINSIPKDGGNVFTGAAFLGGSAGAWQSDNTTAELEARGLSSANRVAHIRIFSASIGGPIKRNRAWFFFAARHADTDEIIADMPSELTLTAAHLNRPFTDWCSGGSCGPFGLRPGDVERTQVASYLRDAMIRLNIQVTAKNKFAVLFNRSWKDKDNELSFGVDPVFASTIRDNREGLYPWGYAKWTTTMSSKVMFEAGWAWSVYAKTSGRQKPFNDLPRYLDNGQFNPQWIGNARRQDTALNKNPFCTLPDGCLVWWTGGGKSQAINARYPISASMSYVTGSHNIKIGFNWTFGPDRTHTDRQADLIQRYTNGVPQSVQVFNTPMYVNAWYNAKAIYLQDSWTYKRLTLTPGVRVEYLQGRMNEIAVPAGRFVPARFFPEENNLPNWKNDVAPRVSVAYDVFGDGRTAIKASFSKYYDQGGRSNFANLYAAAASVNEVRNWFDVDLVPGTASSRSGIPKPTDGDDIAQDNEIGVGSSTFGRRAERQYDPEIERTSNIEMTAGINHELFRRVAVGGTFYRRTYQNLVSADRVNITDADYTAFQARIPNFSNDPTLTGVLDPNEMITIYNLNPAKRGDFALIRDRNGSNESVYTGFETSFTARLPGGTSVYGGWTIERNLSIFCDTNDNPNGSTIANRFEGTAANGGRFCDEGAFDVPFVSDLKIAGNMVLPYGVSFGAILQNYPGNARIITWSPAANVFPGSNRTNTELIILSQPGSTYQPRYNQVDINFKKNFRHGNKVFTGQLDLFNVTNSASILTTTDAVGSSLGGVESILKGRIPRVAFQMRF
jgi:hypothetical protein